MAGSHTMSPVIITDSNAYVPPSLLARHPVIVVPNRIQVSDETWRDTEITAAELFARLHHAERALNGTVPRALPPCPNAIEQAFAKASKMGDEVVAVHMSRHLSPTFQAVENMARTWHGVSFRIIDSCSVSLGLGQLVARAAQLAAQGASLMKINQEVTSAVPTVFASFFAESMHYLERSAHLAASQVQLGSLLKIKTMLSMEEGKLLPLEKVRTRAQLMEKLFQHIIEFSDIRSLGIMHHGYQEEAKLLRTRLQEHDPDLAIQTLPYPASLAAHLGPNVIGVIIQEDDS